MDDTRTQTDTAEVSPVLQATLDALPAQIVLLDAAGVVLTVNRAWERGEAARDLFGERGVAPGQNYLEACRKSDGPGHQALATAARALEELVRDRRGAMVQTCPGQGPGATRTYLLRATRVVGRDGPAAVVAHQEAGDYWASGETRRGPTGEHARRTHLLERALDALSDAVIVVDRDGQFLLSNPVASRLSAMAATDMGPVDWRKAHGVFELDRKTPVAAERMPLARAIRGELVDNFEGFLRSAELPDGVWVNATARPLLDEQGHLLGGVMVVRDVSERRRAEAMLRQKEATNRALLDAMPDLICRIGRDGRLRSLNAGRDFGPLPPLSRLMGLTLRQIRERYEMPPAELVDEAMNAIERALRTGETQFFDQRIAFRGDMRVYDTRVVVSGPDEVLGIVRDVTERRRIEARLELSSRMVSVGTLAAGAAHEINNPLTYILANLRFVSDELERLHAERPVARIGELREWIADAREGAEQVHKSVRALKTFSQADGEESRAIDLLEVLDDALRLTANALRHRARVVRTGEGSQRVRGDRGRLCQVFVQLLLNAADALPEGHADEHRVEVRVTSADDAHVVTEVHDTGRGIPEETLGRVFDPFFTTKPLGEGAGLGLTLCHNHVTAMGGDIAIESGEGTTVRVILPAAAPQVRPTPSPPTSSEALQLLVVDDEPAIARSLSHALKGHEVTLASSGREAIELLTRDRSFDAIVCDLIMSDRTGMDVFQTCLERGDGLEARILFITGGAFTSGARDFLASTANPWLEKPFDLRSFRRLVEELAAAR